MSIEQELIEQKLFELLESSSFNQLSKEESDFVLRQMSKEQYEEQYLSMVKIAELESEEQYKFIPSPDLEKELFRESNKKSILSLITDLFSTKISVGYALPILLIGIFFLVKGNQDDTLKSNNYSNPAPEEYAETSNLKTSIDTFITVIKDTIYMENPATRVEVIPEEVAYHNHMNNAPVEETLKMSVAVQESNNGTANGLTANDNPYADFVPPLYGF